MLVYILLLNLRSLVTINFNTNKIRRKRTMAYY